MRDRAATLAHGTGQEFQRHGVEPGGHALGVVARGGARQETAAEAQPVVAFGESDGADDGAVVRVEIGERAVAGFGRSPTRMRRLRSSRSAGPYSAVAPERVATPHGIASPVIDRPSPSSSSRIST